MKIKIGLLSFLLACSFTQLDLAFAQGTAFTYQGQLQTASGPTHGLYDFTFAVYNASSGGSQFGSTVQTNGVFVTNGLFQTYVDFGPGIFNGTTYWLQIGVRTNGAASFTALAGRQQLTPSPYAIYAEGGNAGGLTGTLPSASLSGAYSGVVSLNNAGNSFSGSGAGLTGVDAALFGGLPPADFWQLSGNVVSPGQFLGSLNPQPVVLKVNNVPELTLALNGSLSMNTSTAGGINSVALGFSATTSGGTYEVAIGNAPQATGNGSVAIGWLPNSSGPGAVALGESVTSSGNDAFAAGYGSQASGQYSVAMGHSSSATGTSAWALGNLAQALNNGSFVWADESSNGVFGDTSSNQFLIRAAGGVGINTTAPAGQLDVEDKTATGNGIYATTPGLNGNGILAQANNGASAFGVWGETLDGYGVVGTANGGGTGIWGSGGTNGYGVQGTSPYGVAVYGSYQGGGTAAGVEGVTASTASSAYAVYGLVSSTSPGGSSAAVRGQNNGTGGSGIGVYGSQNGSGWGVYGYAPSGIGVLADSSTGTGVEGESSTGTGVFAYSGSGSALTVGNGAIHISNSGTNSTSTAAFIQVATAANTSGDLTIINNSLCNNDPNAILLVTPTLSPQGTFNGVYNNHPIGVYYNGSQWGIFEQDLANVPIGASFNVLIIKN